MEDREPKAGSSPEPDAAERVLAVAVAHLAAGEVDAALRAASSACHAAPDGPSRTTPTVRPGRRWANIFRAEEAFAAVLQRAPHWADALVNRGVARYRRGAIDDARTAMRQTPLFESLTVAGSVTMS